MDKDGCKTGRKKEPKGGCKVGKKKETKPVEKKRKFNVKPAIPKAKGPDFITKVEKEEKNILKDIRNPSHGYIGLTDSQVVVKKQKFRNTTKAKFNTLFKKVVGCPINNKGETVKSLSIVGLVKRLLKSDVPQKDIETIYKKYRAEMTA